MNGVFVLDKPQGLTSFDMVAQVRRAAREKRVGHAGTLDPMATGVLVLCLGEATKLVPYLQDADKEYLATARLGVVTDTDDAAPGHKQLTVATAEQLATLTLPQIEAALRLQVGEVVQMPPRFSALKVAGERLYDRARRDLSSEEEAALQADVEKKSRPVRIDDITVTQASLDSEVKEVTFRVRCGKGTYIRAIARDLGEQLEVGAHLTMLRRLRVGRFGVEHAVTLSDIASGLVAPHSLTAAVAHLQTAQVPQELALRIRQGQRRALDELAELLPPITATAPVVAAGPAAAAIIDEAQQLAAVVEPQGQRWIIARGFAAL